MPKGFSERERRIIRDRLLARGRECLQTYGIRKTSVEDLSRAAGISKGAFYRFYASKEELFLAVIEQLEAEFRARVLAEVRRPSASPRQACKDLLSRAFAIWKADPILGKVNKADYEQLLRKLPEERVLEHIRSDDAFVTQLIERWSSDGMRVDRDPSVVAGLMQALFFVGLHEEDFGRDVYPRTMETLIELVAQYLVG